MEVLLQKSEDNFFASKVLIEKDYPNSSVHCSYYSCLQLMTYILVVKFGETINTLSYKSKEESKGSHEVVINLLGNHLKTMNVGMRTFNNDVNQLKFLRVEVDYKDKSVSKEEGRKIRESAQSVRENLKKIFAI
jgi:uncharacterized protein (UPF0332 family)